MLDPDAVREAFQKNFSLGPEVGAAVSVWCDGREIIREHGGHRDAARSVPWTDDTLCLIWSATKGPASACVLHAIGRAGLDIDHPVSAVWPEFAASGKGAITFAQALSHGAGLSVLDETVSALDHPAVARAIERQAPLWPPGEAHGYSPRVYGFLADEIVRRLSGGVTLGAYWREVFAEPLGLDLWIGLPAREHPRVATMLAPRAGGSDGGAPFLRAFMDPGSTTRRAFANPAGLMGASAMNAPGVRSASIPSFGGIGSASALAAFYGTLACGGGGIVADRILGWMRSPLTSGRDRVLCTETAFSAGFMVASPGGRGTRGFFGPGSGVFGHPGAGGSLGFSDPENRIGFAYVMNQMEVGALPMRRAQSLVDALYQGKEGEFTCAV